MSRSTVGHCLTADVRYKAAQDALQGIHHPGAPTMAQIKMKAKARDLFREADQDNSGELSTDELVDLFKKVYKAEGRSRHRNKVNAEVPWSC